MNKLEYLKEFRKDVEIISLSDAKPSLSDEWLLVFEETNQHKRIQKVIDIWTNHCKNELRNTIMYLNENLRDVNLIRTSDGISILYELKMFDGSVDYYEGLLSVKKYDDYFNSWNSLPNSLRDFYSFVHNGFYYYASQNMGILPIQKISCMDDYDWGIIDDLNLDIPFKLKTTYIFFETGMGGYVLLDTNEFESENSTVWFSNKKPMYDKNFWDIVDEWIVMGFN